jgi:ABC-type multidrug transport system fused ATPase/permease subunit
LVVSLNQDKSVSTRQIIWSILTKAERRRTVFVLLLMLVGSVLETFSLGLVVPVVGLLVKPNYVQNFPAIDNFLGHPSEVQFAVIAMTFLVVIYFLKSAFLVWSAWIQSGFSLGITARIGRELFENYLRQPYPFHLQRNSSVLIRNSQSSTALMGGVFDPMLSIMTDSLVTLGLFSLLIKLEPIGSLTTLAVFGLSAFSFRRFTSARIKKWGEAQNNYRRMIIQHLQQGLGGVKDVKILGREDYFISEYSEQLTGSAAVVRRYNVSQMMPRTGLEILTITGLAVLVSTMVVSGEDLSNVLPVLGLFGAAAFRLVPAVSRMVTMVQTIAINRPIVNELFHDLSLRASNSPKRQNHDGFDQEVEVNDLSFKYETAPTNALSNVSLRVKRGEAVGLVGPSGSGKSTLVDVLLGLMAPASGAVLVDGVNVQDRVRWWQDQIGYVPQSIFLTDDTLRRNVAFGLPKSAIDDAAVDAAIRAAQLEEFVKTLPLGLETVVGERGVRLSGGQRQRIGIARALYHNPDVLVLDEATSSLDTETEHGVMQAVQALQGNKTVIIVAHRLSTVEYCDRLYRLESSRIVDEGTFEEVMNRSRED